MAFLSGFDILSLTLCSHSNISPSRPPPAIQNILNIFRWTIPSHPDGNMLLLTIVCVSQWLSDWTYMMWSLCWHHTKDFLLFILHFLASMDFAALLVKLWFIQPTLRSSSSNLLYRNCACFVIYPGYALQPEALYSVYSRCEHRRLSFILFI